MVEQGSTTMGTIIGETAIQAFKASLRGELLLPDDNGYDIARKVWNAMIDKHPAMIVRCAGVADVISAVNFGRAHRLLVAVRGGGHNVAGKAMCDDGLVIDLSQMKGIRVDPTGRTVRAEGGATWQDLDHETQAFGLATTGGTVSTTGIAGLTLGGGFGWLMRQYGLACDNLLSVDIVTADGRLLTASPGENQDFFWGVRGGGGNFGVVTSFEYRLHPVGSMLGGMVLYPLARATEVLQFYREFTATAPDELTAIAGLLSSPEGTPMVAILVCYNGSIETGERVIEPLRTFGPPLADEVRPMTYCEVQTMLDTAFPAGLHNYFKSSFLKSLSNDAIDTIVSHFATVPSPLPVTVIEHFGGAVARIGKEETAFSHRDGHYNLVIVSRWTDPAESATYIRWAREFWEALRPFATDAVYVNYLEEGQEGANRIKAAYGTNYEQLVALKNKYDPKNFFRMNQNIQPTH